MSWNQLLYKELLSSAYNFAYGYVKDADSAKDIVQTVFVRLFEKRETLVVQESVKAYLYRAVLNECLNHHKKESTRHQHHEAYSHELHQSLESGIEQSEEEHWIYQAIKNLPLCRFSIT